MQINTSTAQLREYLETKQGKTYFIATITMITVAIMLVFAIVPASTSITDKIAQNKVRREYLDALTEKETNIKNLLTQEEQSQNQLLFLDASLPGKRNDEFILANLGEMANVTNTHVVVADFGESSTTNLRSNIESQQMLRQVPITLSVQGTIPNLGDFIRKLESFPMPFLIESISYSNKSVQNQNLPANQGDTLLALKINYYYYDDVTE